MSVKVGMKNIQMWTIDKNMMILENFIILKNNNFYSSSRKSPTNDWN